MHTLTDLLAYCRKVAGSVGMLSIHASGRRLTLAHGSPRRSATPCS